ncbi:MAG TPA: PEGA domain-containing protein [Kofleriaceae bacterium]|nr:PEGA domain-containing protein [Kofleriaceae bacterium]
MKQLLLAAFVSASVAVAATPAWAQPKPSPAFTKEFQAGVDAFRLGQYDEAIKHLDAAAKLEPSLPGPHRFLAAVAQAQSRWNDCITASRKAIELNPNSSEIAATRKLHDACRESDGRPMFSGEYGTGGALSVTANVAGATVSVDGLKYGATPLTPRAFALGEVTVEATKSGWKSASGKTKVLPGVVTDLELTLEEDKTVVGPGDGDKPTPEIGWLKVDTVPGATVRVNGKPWAIDERGRFALMPGTHEIEITAPGRVTEWRTVRVSKGQEATIAVDLESRAVRAKRQRTGRVGLAAAVGFGAVGAMTAMLSSDALDDARDAWVIETTRPTSVPLSETVGVRPLRKREEIDALVARSDRWAKVSYVSYGLAAVSLGVGVYMLSRAPEEKRPKTTIAPLVPGDGDGAWGMAITGVLP